jgi:hypothetical protein
MDFDEGLWHLLCSSKYVLGDTMQARRFFLPFLTLILGGAVALPPAGLSQTAQSKPSQTKSAQTKPATQTQSSKKADVIEWPKEIQAKNGKVMIYQPQIDEWTDYKVVKARSAVAYLPTGQTNPKLGIIEMQSKTEVDMESRLVKLLNIEITGCNFPGATKEENAKALVALKALIKPGLKTISLDRMIASLERAGVKNVDVKNDPPKIFFSKKPAVLVMFDGKPLMSPIKDNELKFAVNTNWDVFYYEKDKTYFLRNEKNWLKAASTNGPWSPANKLPDAFKKLPLDDNWKDVKLAIPPEKLKDEDVPIVYVSEEPAEMILLTGEPDYKPITQTNITQVANTQNILLFNPKDSSYYYLVSGRWFSTKSLENGPWVFATPNLPEDFKKIPAESEIGKKVRASIPGTREAEEAVIQAGIPQSAQINKKQIKPPAVQYAGGKPEFQAIEKTELQRAVNTDADVIQVKNEYYLCQEGVWFVSNSPNGPWAVAEKIPQEIYNIPPSSPAYNVTYVTVQEDTDSTDEWVTVAVAAGYFGTMIASDCVFWGTGWYYPPYYGYYGGYPYYYPYYGSYGAAAWYNPYTGTFGRSGWAYGPYGGVGYGARYNPRTGTYARGAGAYGPYGYRGYAEAYNPRTGTSARTRQGGNYYGQSWGSTAVRRGNDWARTSHISGDEGGAMRYKTSNGNSGFVGRNGDDLYAGRNGDLYRKTDNGWQNYNNGNWNNVDRGDINRPTPSSSTRDLDRASSSRSWGNTRSSGASNFSRSRGSMPRGGGGRRR